MKKFTRIASLLLALVMVLGLAATAFAEEDQQFTLTIDTHYTTQAFDVYQIFAGTVKVNEEGQREISDLTWGANVTEEGKAALLTFDGNAFADITELVKYLNDNRTTDKEIAERFVTFAEKYLTENYMERIIYVEGTGYQATLPGGYYLIKNPDEIDYGIFASDLMLYVLGNMTISPKVPGPKIWKVVYDNNDSINPVIKSVKDSQGNYAGISTWDIGDDARFMLNGTIPVNISAYETYKYEFHDQWAEGLFAPVAAEDIEVYISSQTKYAQIDAAFYEFVATENGFVVKMDLAAVYDEYVVKNGDQIFTDGSSAKNILVKYTAELLNPTMGAHLNTNKAWIEYEGGKTEETTTWTGTLDFTVYKYDEEGDPLSGAEFQLQKFMQADDGTETVSITYEGETKTYTGKWVVFCEKMELTQDNADVVSYYAKGLDEGIYKLVETKAPAGYKIADDLIFKVDTAENYALGYISQIRVHDDKGESGPFGRFTQPYMTTQGEIEDITGFTVGVVNVRDGFILPETGGMGTTLFYVLGAILVLGAAVLLITKRRMNIQK